VARISAGSGLIKSTTHTPIEENTMAMSRKHYRQAAELISNALESVSEDNDVEQAVRDKTTAAVKDVADGLADMFRADNSRFNRSQFMAACGL
jgi:hypothetical protein